MKSTSALLLILIWNVTDITRAGEVRSKSIRLNQMISTLRHLLANASTSAGFEDVPPFTETEVHCSIHINNITAITESEQTFSVDVFLNTIWTDPRLDHENITEEFVVPDRFHSKIWVPDIGFSNGKGGHIHQVTQDNKNLLLNSNGTVILTVRVAVVLGCLMNFTYYPLDTQVCELQLQSWRYNRDEVKLIWRSDAFSLSEGATFSLPQYETVITTTQNLGYECVEEYSGTGRGSYSCLELVFLFKRLLRFYALDIYVPSALIVIISFISVFIVYNIVPARVGIGSLSVSAMTNIMRSFKLSTPPVSYIKAADVWVWSCQIFVFAVFLEFGLVNVFNRAFKIYKRKDTFLLRSTPAKTLDKISRIFFPCSFLLFNLIYWSYFLSTSNYNASDYTAELLQHVASQGSDGAIPG